MKRQIGEQSARRTGREGSALLGVLGAMAVVGAMAVAGFVQVTASRRALELSHARRLAEMCGLSAIEEAAAILEGSFRDLGRPGDARDLGASLGWPGSIEPGQSRADASAVGFDMGPVAVRSSGWQVQRVTRPDGRRLLREIGVLELRARVSGRRAVLPLGLEVRVRRHATAVPVGDGTGIGLRIGGTNLTYLAVRE